MPALRRAQVIAQGSEAGLRVAQYLLGLKLDGQRANLERHLPHATDATALVAEARSRLDACERPRDLLSSEALAAVEYWGALSQLPMRFARSDVDKVPSGGSRSANVIAC